jgi:hypothetical protein
MPVTIKAKLIYDPTDVGVATRKGFQPWWAAAMLSNNLTAFYRHLIFLQTGETLTAPMWRSHVSVIRGEEPRNKGAWKKFHGREVTIQYFPERAMQNDKYVWFPAHSVELEDIREELGLRRTPKTPFHLTIGNRKGSQPRKVVVPFRTFSWENLRTVEQSWRSPKKTT